MMPTKQYIPILMAILLILWDIFCVKIQKHNDSIPFIRNMLPCIVVLYFSAFFPHTFRMLGFHFFPKYTRQWMICIGACVYFFLISVLIAIQYFDDSSLISFLIIAPICEEMLYRSILCACIQTCFSNVAAPILCSGLAFAVLHIAHGNFVWIHFFSGCILAWAFIWGKTIFLPIVLHSIGNLLYNKILDFFQIFWIFFSNLLQ